MSKVKGYKVFNEEWTCRDFQYEVGGTYEYKGDIRCGRGFHFCQKASDCFNYYSFNPNNKVAEVEALDLVATEGNKSVTNKIHIIREIPWMELLTIVNEGSNCTGLSNAGSSNEGDYNTGDKNTGGYLKEFAFKEACANMWECLTEEEKKVVVNELPNFDAEIFAEITGIIV